MSDSHPSETLTIDQQHREIVACCDELLAVVALDDSAAEVARIRLRLASLLHLNLAAEEREVMAPLRRLPIDQRPKEFAVLTSEAARLRANYSEHVRAWNLLTIAGDHKGYGRDAADLIRQMRSHLQRKQALFLEWKPLLG